MKILKFGGTSVGSHENILKVLSIAKEYHQAGTSFAIVVSAMSQITNLLMKASTQAASGDETYQETVNDIEQKHMDTVAALIDVQDQSELFAHIKRVINELDDFLKGVFLIKEISLKSQDFVLSHGERLSAFIIDKAGQRMGLPTKYVDARTIVRTDSTHGSAKVNYKLTKELVNKELKKGTISIVTGFISSDAEGTTTTLGRGGSDFTASILAVSTGAEGVEIWTDVNGVMTADPRMVKKAFSLPMITYSEAMEMTHFGAKVIYPPTLQPLVDEKIPIKIKNTFNPFHPGTLISEQSGEPNKLKVKGISSIKEISLVSVQGSGMVGVSGISARLFSSLANEGVNLILITQASSEHSITFAVEPQDAVKAKKAIHDEFHYEIEARKINTVKVEDNLSIVAAIGENMKNTTGISGKLFHSLGRNGINIVAIAQGSSELNVSVVIQRDNLSKALNTLHDAFFLSLARTVNLFVVGPGLIGGTLLDQIKQQQDYLVSERLIDVKVVGLANSRKMLFNSDGIDLTKWKEGLAQEGKDSSFKTFVDEMKAMNLPNSVYVDNTSNKEIIEFYEEILSSNISIVTPNKVANSGSYADYAKLKKATLKSGASFLYETNVGAGLPVINTLQNLIHSGDEILKIEGVLSGSLSFIFNSYDGSKSFKDVVLDAKDKGFTEPDPRDDLNGMDVARKILILAREAGFELEPSDVQVNNILPQACIDAGSVDDFFAELEKADAVFEGKRKAAADQGKKLCFIASLEDGKLTVDLNEVGADHPFFSLSGSDNMISFTTQRYKENPLVIKGPGAGAEVTAAGVFADIISVSND
ncbi:MAG: bifunctional aspartate kinase/homoserine dehydrogenase I [Cyclobacteriaceae bacterium]